MAAKTTKKKQIETQEAEQVRTTVKSLKPTDVLSAIATAQVSLQKTLSDVASQVNEKIDLLNQVQTAIEIEQARLEELHGIDAAAMTLDEMETQIKQASEQASESENERNARWIQEEADRKVLRQREQADYDYNLKLNRKKVEDEWQALLEKRQREEAARQEILAKGWKEREESIASQEKEIAELRNQVAAIPVELKKAVDREVAIASNSIKREYETKILLAQKDTEASQKLSEASLNAANQTIARQQSQITELQTQVLAANERAESIARSAVEASSGRQALEAVQRQTETLGQSTGKSR